MNGDGKRLRQGAGPSLPAGYVQAVDGCFVGPSAGSCGGRGIAERKGLHVRHRHQSPLGRWSRQTALFIGSIRGRLSLKELGQLAGGIHHNAVGIAIRRFTQRLQSDHALLEKVSLVQKELRAKKAAKPKIKPAKPAT